MGVEDEEEEKGFFMRRLALNADVRLLLIDVSVSGVDGDAEAERVGDGDPALVLAPLGDDLNDRRSSATIQWKFIHQSNFFVFLVFWIFFLN